MTDDPLAELTCGDDDRAERAIPAILKLGAAAIPRLLELAQSQDSDSRWWAARALAASPHARTSDLVPFLGDSNPEIRAAAALGLSHHPGGDALPALIKAMGDSDPLTAGLAANALVNRSRAGGSIERSHPRSARAVRDPRSPRHPRHDAVYSGRLCPAGVLGAVGLGTARTGYDIY